MDIGPTALVIVLVIVVLVFGVGRVGKLGGELGYVIREFRQGLSGGKNRTPGRASGSPDAQPSDPVEPARTPEPTEWPKS